MTDGTYQIEIELDEQFKDVLGAEAASNFKDQVGYALTNLGSLHEAFSKADDIQNKPIKFEFALVDENGITQSKQLQNEVEIAVASALNDTLICQSELSEVLEKLTIPQGKVLIIKASYNPTWCYKYENPCCTPYFPGPCQPHGCIVYIPCP
jgi:hypothetical protein